MKKMIGIAVFLVLVITPEFVSAQPHPDLVIWKEFVLLLKADALPLDRIQSGDIRTPESRLAGLKDFVKGTDWTEWEAAPEVVRHGNLVSFITTLGKSRNSPWKYIFCFAVEEGRWSFRFMEGIFIRLDQIGDLPADAAGFPDLPEDRKHWMRQEYYWSKMVWLYNEMTRLKGTDYALSLFRDGAGYALAATVWIPFYPTHRAFILYLCWEQAKLQGNKVTLEKLDDNEAVVRFDDNQYFALYQQASHLKEQIALGDYIGIFEAIWQDRARAAGWDLQIDGQGRQIFLRFSRK
jgi:hypothetical protein